MWVRHQSSTFLSGRHSYLHYGYRRSLIPPRSTSSRNSRGSDDIGVESDEHGPGELKEASVGMISGAGEAKTATMATTMPRSPLGLEYFTGEPSPTSSDGELATTEEMQSYEEDLAAEAPDSRYCGNDLDDRNLRPESRPTLRRPHPRSVTTWEVGACLPDRSQTTKMSRPPGENRSPNVAHRPWTLPQSTRSLSHSPLSPTLMTQRSHSPGPRSPSPAKPLLQNGAARSSPTVGGASPWLSSETLFGNGNGLMPRRSSWQPGRKTVKELEAEYNDNQDEDVPDDAVLGNVPISPMPGQHKRFSPHPSRSTTPSPHRRPPPPPPPPPQHQPPPTHASRAGLHSANVPKNAKRPCVPTMLPNGRYGTVKPSRSPRHRRPPPLQHSPTIGAFPSDVVRPRSRTRSKSWTEDLNEEARKLSAALEEFAERQSTDARRSGASSAATSPTRPSTEPKSERPERKLGGLVDMPPKQTGSVMIDPLPISKEKEAVLTRTRPSWLPPKSQKEERRHLREWERMMARAAEKEQKRASREKAARQSRDEAKETSTRIWDQHVLPKWDTAIHEPQTKDLCWSGIPPELRGLVWQRAIGNELDLTPTSFDAALQRATSLATQLTQLPPGDPAATTPEAQWLVAIARDASGSPTPSSVLQAYAWYRRDVGYVHCTHHVVAHLVTHLSAATRPATLFILLANLLNRPLPRAFLLHDAPAMTRTHAAVLAALARAAPRLHAHLAGHCPDPADFLDPLFRSLLAARSMPPACAARVWDAWLFAGDNVLVCAAVAVLVQLAPVLEGGSRGDVLDVLGWQASCGEWEVGDEEEFVALVRSIVLDEQAR